MKLPTFDLKKSLSNPKESKLFLSLAPTLKQKKIQQFTTLSLTFITIAFFGLFAINPTLTTIFDLQKQLDDNTFVNDQLQKKIANLTTLQGLYNQIQPQLDPVLQVLPTNPALDIFVGQIHTLAQQDSVQINRVQTFPVDVSPQITAKANYLSYSFSIEAQGTLEDLSKYVADLGSFNRLITFENVTLSRVGVITNTFRSSIRGDTYFKQDIQ